MARAWASWEAKDTAGNVLPGAEITIYEVNGTTVLTQSLYAGPVGGAPIPNPLTANIRGIAQAYVDTPKRCVAKIQGISYVFDFSDDPADLGGYVTTDGIATLTNKTLIEPTIVDAEVTGGSFSSPQLDAPDLSLEATHPAAPAVNRLRLYYLAGELWARDAVGPFQMARYTDRSIPANPILNGGFQVWQKGVNFPSAGTNTWGPDGWLWQQGGTGMVVDFKKSADVPPMTVGLAPLMLGAAQIEVTTGSGAVGVNHFGLLATRIEGYEWEPFALQPFAVGFWVKASVAGPYAVFCRNWGAAGFSDRSSVQSFTIAAPNVWEYHIASFPASPIAGTWDYTNGRGVEIGWAVVSGTNFRTTPGPWTVGNLFAATGGVDTLGATVGNSFRLGGVSMGQGSAPRPYFPQPFPEVVRRAKRYYMASYEYGTTIATATPAGWIRFIVSDNNNAKNITIPIDLSIEMRTTPTVSLYDHLGAGGAGAAARGTAYGSFASGGAATPNTPMTFSPGAKRIEAVGQVNAAGIAFHYVARAEIP